MVNEQLIRVDIEDIKSMRTRCKELFLKSHPEFKKIKLTDKFMFFKIVEFYLK